MASNNIPDATWYFGAAPGADAPNAAPAATAADDASWYHDVANTPPVVAPPPPGGLPYLANVAMGFAPPVTDTQKVVANAMTGLYKAPGAALGIPHSIAQLGDYIGAQLPGSASTDQGIQPGWVTRHTYSPEEITGGLHQAAGWLNQQVGLPEPQPLYKPETGLGRFAQDVISTAPTAAIGGGGLIGLASREAANLAGTGGMEVAQKLYPNSPAIQMGTGLLAAVLTDRVPTTAMGLKSYIGDITGQLAGSKSLAQTKAAEKLVNESGLPSKQDLIDSIDNGYATTWAPFDNSQNARGVYNPVTQQFDNQLEAKPTLADVTMNTGLRDLTYKDQALAPPAYQQNRYATNAAQREAVSNIAPDLNPQIANTNPGPWTLTLPTGISAQEAGSTFRQGLQNVYDQRLQARQTLGNSVFDQLDNSPTQINLKPVMDYATTQAAQQAGEVGNAYKAALNQFKTGTGITLDTAPFSNSVLKGLGDLAQSYPPGSAANRAVLDVKNRAEAEIFNQEPSIATARQAYAQASQPLDIFDPRHTPGPIANAVQTTRFGGYTAPNDAVVGQFLRSTGSADAIDRLASVFPDVKSATQSLQDYIASQVRDRAVNPDGTVNLTNLESVLQPYQAVLNKPAFADLKRQFSTIQATQDAMNGLQARQKIYDTFSTGLGTQETDQVGNQIYSGARFNNYLANPNNRQEIINAYGGGQAGQEAIDVLDRVNDQLRSMQTAYARVPGQSGTPQAMPKNGIGTIAQKLFIDFTGIAGGVAGLGDIASNIVGSAGGGRVLAAAAGLGAGLWANKRAAAFNDSIQGVVRQALVDPIFARSLLEKYNPKLPSTTGRKAMDYVQSRLPGIVAPLLNQQNRVQ